MSELMKTNRQRFLWMPLILFVATMLVSIFLFERNHISSRQFDFGMALSFFFLATLFFLWAYWAFSEKTIYFPGLTTQAHNPSLYWATIFACTALGLVCAFYGVQLCLG